MVLILLLLLLLALVLPRWSFLCMYVYLVDYGSI